MQSPRKTLLCQYRYDPLDRLIANALPNAHEHQRFYCKNRLVTEIQGATRYSIVQHGEQLLAQQKDDGVARDIALLATNQQCSVLLTLKDNQPPEPIAYSPYGHLRYLAGLLSLLGFNGERPDPVTGCYLLGNGYRAFNTVLMRFNSPDSLSPFGKGGLNAYSYCAGDPINKSDPTGHCHTAGWTKMILGKNLTASTLAEKSIITATREINLTPSKPFRTPVKLKKNTTPQDALYARAEISLLEEQAGDYYHMNMIYTDDLNRASASNTAIITSSQKNQLKLLKYIESNTADGNDIEKTLEKLQNAMRGHYDPAIPISQHPTPQMAMDYYFKLISSENKNAATLLARARKIRDTHFSEFTS